MSVYGAPVHSSAVYRTLCAGRVSEQPPLEGWPAFFRDLVFCTKGSTSAEEALRGTRNWDIFVRHKPTRREYELDEVVGHGAYARVWKLTLRPPASHNLPQHLVLKVFGASPSWQSVAEISVVDRMELVDLLSGTTPTDRIPARALSSLTGIRAIVMPFAPGSLADIHHVPQRVALKLLKATLAEVRAMHETYKLWCVDVKNANFLYDCNHNEVRVRAADYGGYANEGDVALSTYCIPWDSILRDEACEELCVYGLFVLFLSLCLSTEELTAMNAVLYTPAIVEDDERINEAYDAGIPIPEKRSLAYHRRIFAMPWSSSARRVLGATTRFRPSWAGYGGQPLTLRALDGAFKAVNKDIESESDDDA